MTRDPDLALDARVDAGPDVYRFRTAAGLDSPDAFRDADLLLADALWDHDPDDLLVRQANYGVVGTLLAPRCAVTMTETSARAARVCETNVRANGVDAAVRLCPTLDGTDDRSVDAVAYAPGAYTPNAVVTARLDASLAALRPDGRLFLAAAPGAGLDRYAAHLRRRGARVERPASRGDVRLVVAARPAAVERDPVAPREYAATVRGVEVTVVTRPGLFAADGLDDGTRLLLETTGVGDGERVCDLACGAGPVGAVAARTADVRTTLTDDDARATACARRTLAASGVDGRVVTADCARGVDGPFDRVLCNPPTHAGEGVLVDLFRGARRVLAPGGVVELVVHRALDPRPWLRPFGRVERAAAGERHVVWRARP